MLVFSAISPHPPILIPTIGKENLERINQTVQAMKKLNEELIKAKPETILIISPHLPLLSDAFSLLFAQNYLGGFEEFGDFSTKLEFKADIKCLYQIKENLENQFPLVFINQSKLDHGSLVPLYYLTKNINNFSIVPLGYSFLDYQTHLNFGKALKEEIFRTNKRIAVIASGDLSHRLTSDAPGGYSPSGKVFDHKLIELLKEKDVQGILNLDHQLIEEAGECGLRSFLILLGILEEVNYQPELLSYEGPFGVGYLVMNFKLGD